MSQKWRNLQDSWYKHTFLIKLIRAKWQEVFGTGNNVEEMTQIKEEPCDYDDVPKAEIVLTTIEVKDPLDIKLEPVLDEKEPEFSEPKNGTDVDLDKIDLIHSDNEDICSSEKEEFSDTKTDDNSEDDDFEVPEEDFAIHGI